ncbi:MAG: Stp1/IreP family PP2C-type Ser/Thr phosphatase [Chloroflexaceae bacterium]
MPICALCGSDNAADARFCRNCAAPLPRYKSSTADNEWLAASLSSVDFPADPARSAQPRHDHHPGTEEKPMHQPAPILFAGRYELPPAAADGPLVVVDTAPWRRCWACGSTANEPDEAFCIDCGAALERRPYPAVLTPADAPSGPALVTAIDDEHVRALLPEIWDQVEEGGRVLTVLNDSGRAPLSTSLDETAALALGLALARLLESLHARGLALGPVAPADLEPVPGGAARLRTAPHLRPIAPDDAAAVQTDLLALADLLERLTATPRATLRLSEEAAEAAAYELPLVDVLRQVRIGAFADAAGLVATLEHLLAQRTRPLPLRQVVGAHTDTGIVREHNEDSLFALQLTLINNNQPEIWGVYIVADGMGGHAAGEVASGLAVRAAADLFLGEYLARAVQPDVTFSEEEAVAFVRRAVQRANEAVIAESRRQANDMGTTFTMALVAGDRVIIGNVGDSRTYLFRDGRLRRITRDHSLVQRLVDLGQIAQDDIYSHPQRNAVLRSLGDRSEIEIDVFTERLRPGDALLLCSDGQWEMTRDPDMERLLAREESPQAVCEALVAAANQAGGEDNIAVILVRFE